MSNAAGPISVPTVTIDSFCAREGLLPSFIKIDVEGAELAVLRGARETIRRGGDALALFVELHPSIWSLGGKRRAPTSNRSSSASDCRWSRSRRTIRGASREWSSGWCPADADSRRERRAQRRRRRAELSRLRAARPRRARTRRRDRPLFRQRPAGSARCQPTVRVVHVRRRPARCPRLDPRVGARRLLFPQHERPHARSRRCWMRSRSSSSCTATSGRASAVRRCTPFRHRYPANAHSARHASHSTCRGTAAAGIRRRW